MATNPVMRTSTVRPRWGRRLLSALLALICLVLLFGLIVYVGLSPLVEYLLVARLEAVHIPANPRLGSVVVGFDRVNHRLCLDVQDLLVNDLAGQRVLSVGTARLWFSHFAVEPHRVELEGLWVDLQGLGALARSQRRQVATTAPPLETTQRPNSRSLRRNVPIDGLAITDATVLVSPSLALQSLAVTVKPAADRQSDLTVEHVEFTADVRREGTSTSVPVGPAQGRVAFEHAGDVCVVLNGAPLELSMQVRPGGTIAVETFRLTLPHGGTLSFAGSLQLDRSPPLECRLTLENIQTKHLPLPREALGNLVGGVLNLKGSYKGTILDTDDGQASCSFSLLRPHFLVRRGSRAIPLHLDRLSAAITYSGGLLSLDGLSVEGFDGSVHGGASVDFSSKEGVGWTTQLTFDTISLPEVARYFDFEGVKRGQATGEVVLTGGGGVPYEKEDHGIAGYVVLERVDVDYLQPDRNLLFELRNARCEVRHTPPTSYQAFLRYGRLEVSGLSRPLSIPEVTFRATHTGDETTVDFLACRLGRDGTIKVKRAIVPRDANESADVHLVMKNVDSALLDYLKAPISHVPPGSLDAEIHFVGSPRRLHEATVSFEVGFEGASDAPVLSSLDGRFSIQDGKIALEGARAKLLTGWVEAAGRGQFVGDVPTGRFKILARHLCPGALFQDRDTTVPGKLDVTLSVVRTSSSQPAHLELVVAGTSPLELDMRAEGTFCNLFRGRNRLAGSCLTIGRLDATAAGCRRMRSASALTLSVLEDETLSLKIPHVVLEQRKSATSEWSKGVDATGVELLLKRRDTATVVRLGGSTVKVLGQIGVPPVAIAGLFECTADEVTLEGVTATAAGTTMGVEGSVSRSSRTTGDRVDLAFSIGNMSTSSLGALVGSTPPLAWKSLGLEGRATGALLDVESLAVSASLTGTDVVLPTREPLTAPLLEARLETAGAKLSVPHFGLSIPGGLVTASLEGPIPGRSGPWSFGATASVTNPLPLWQAFGGRGPHFTGPVTVEVDMEGSGPCPPNIIRGPYEMNFSIDGLRLLLERSEQGRTLTVRRLSGTGSPSKGGLPFLFSMEANDVVYSGRELRTPNGFSCMKLKGTLGNSLLSLTSSRFDFMTGGKLELTGEVPLRPGLDGEFSYHLTSLDVSSWDPTVIDLNSGLLDFDGTFIGAWDSLSDSIIDLRLRLAGAEVATPGLQPGPFDVSTTVSYRKGSLVLSSLEASILGGTIAGRGSGRWDHTTREVEIRTDFSSLDLAQLLKVNAPPGTSPVPIEGRMSGTLLAKNSGSLRSGFFGSGSLEISGGVLRNVSTAVQGKGKKFLKRFQDLTFSRASSKLVLMKDNVSLRDLELRANFGSLEGWLKIRRKEANLQGRLFANLSKKLIPSSFVKSLVSLVGGRYITVGLVLDGPLSQPKLRVVRSPGRRERFLTGTQ